MRFIDDGPAMPNELIVAQERGETLFVCGADISLHASRRRPSALRDRMP